MNQNAREVLIFAGFLLEVLLFISAGITYFKKEWFYVLGVLGVVVGAFVGKFIAKNAEEKTMDKFFRENQ